MAKIRKTVTVLLGDEYIDRYNLLCARLGTNRSQLLRNLLSGDAALVNVIAEKARTLSNVNIEDVSTLGKTR